MAEETLTLISLEYGKKRWDNNVGVLDENSPVRVGSEEVLLKDYVAGRSITHKVERKIAEDEETRQDALNNLLAYLKSDSASDSERGSLFLVQHEKEGSRSNDYDIYVLMGDSADNYKLQRIGTSIEYTGGGSTQIVAGTGIDVAASDDTYTISLDKHMSEINEYIDFAEQ